MGVRALVGPREAPRGPGGPGWMANYQPKCCLLDGGLLGDSSASTGQVSVAVGHSGPPLTLPSGDAARPPCSTAPRRALPAAPETPQPWPHRREPAACAAPRLRTKQRPERCGSRPATLGYPIPGITLAVGEGALKSYMICPPSIGATERVMPGQETGDSAGPRVPSRGLGKTLCSLDTTRKCGVPPTKPDTQP